MSSSFRIYAVVAVLLLLGCTALTAQTVSRDTVRRLDEVVVTAEGKQKTAVSAVPLQSKSRIEMEALPALQVSDVLKHLSGVNIKDYGGIGGLKTVSVRSLGAEHTAVSYDGISVADGQNGQIDIGRFSLDNLHSVELATGQGDDIFVTARSLASAAVLILKTEQPVFRSRPVTGSLSMRAGSFTTLNPAFTIAGRLSDKLSLQANVDYLYSKGDYPYLLSYGTALGDSTSRERRVNSDVSNLHAELTLFGRDSVQQGYVKLYYYDSQRGLPGATIFYNTASFSSQRIQDRNAFAQARYERQLGQRWQLMFNGKYNYAYTYYRDPAYLGSAGVEENHYHQSEYYLNVAAAYRPLTNLMLSLTADGAITTLDADLFNFARPTRYQLLAALSLKYINSWVTLTGTALLNTSRDVTRDSEVRTNRFRCSPFISVAFRPIRSADFSIRLFYKNIYRLPTFNDLYYSRVGNRDLRPEDTHQLNAGLTYAVSGLGWLNSLVLTADLYYNRVTDKIVAYPTKNIFTWTMLNYGLVDVLGFDFSGDIDFKLAEGYHITVAATYTYNKAINVTDKTQPDYGHQIPYTPRISGSGSATIMTPYVNISYSMIWSGVRYAVNQNYAENRLPGYTDHSLTLFHDFRLGRDHGLTVSLEGRNLANKNYAIIRYFPMPGLQLMGRIKYTF